MSLNRTNPDQPMPRPSRKSPFLLLAGVITLLAIVYFGASIRVVGDQDLAVRDSGWLKVTPVVLQEGWHLVPRGIYRLHRYTRDAAALRFGQDEPLALETPEGATIVSAGTIEYTIRPAQVLALHALCSGDLDGWLQAQFNTTLDAVLRDPQYASLGRDKIPDIQTSIQEELAARLETAGLQIASVSIDGLGYEGDMLIATGPHPTARRKILWLAIDSFDWTIIQPLVEAGRMPHMERLMKEGAWGNLQAIPPLLSPVLWTSAATGKRAEKHGIVDFIASDPETGATLPVTSTLRKTRAFWNILSEAGVSVGVIAWWASFPAEPVNGFMCTDRIAYQLFKGKLKKDEATDDPLKTHPADLYRDVAPLIHQPAQITRADLARFIDMERYAPRFTKDDGARVNEFQTVLAATQTYADIGRKFFSERPTDVRVLYFEGPDTTSHLFMPFVPPAVAGVEPEKVEWFGRVVPEYYAYQDELIGEFVDKYADGETTIILSSDHGFKIGEDRPEGDSRIGHGKAATWHSDQGMVLFAGKDIARGNRILGATILDVVPTLLALYGLPVAEDMDGKVLSAALDPAFLADYPISTIATYDVGALPSAARIAEISQDDQELLEKLESLGYIQQSKPTAHINQGAIYIQTGEYDKAIDSFKTALQELDKESVRLSLARAYRLNGEPEKAEEQLAILTSRGWNPAVVLTERAAVHQTKNEWDQAERLLEEALAAEPDYAEGYFHLGQLYGKQDRLDDSLAAYRRAIEIDPKLAKAHNELGVGLMKKGRIEDAILSIKRAIEVNPDLAGPYNNLGLIYRQTGKADEARKVLETGLTMLPKSAILHNSLGSLLYDSGDIDGAIAAFEKALEFSPDYAEAVSNLAVIYSGRRDAVNAARTLSRLIELEPENHEAYLTLAVALLNQQRVGDAVGTLRDLLTKDPRNHKAMIMLGEIYLRSGKPGEAVGLLEEAGKIEATIPRTWNTLALCYLELERIDAARQALQRSLALNPDQPAISQKLAEIGGG